MISFLRELVKKFSLIQIAFLALILFVILLVIKCIQPNEFLELSISLSNHSFFKNYLDWLKYYNFVVTIISVFTGISFILLSIIFSLYKFYWTRTGYNEELFPLQIKIKNKALDYWMMITLFNIVFVAYAYLFDHQLSINSVSWFVEVLILISKLSMSIVGFILLIQLTGIIQSKK